MALPVRVRGLTEQEGQKIQHIVRRGSTSSVRFRQAVMLLASAGGSTVPVIARVGPASEDTVRDVIHRFNEIGHACLNPQRAGGRPRLLSSDDEDFVIRTATTQPIMLGKPFTRWSVRKLADHLRRNMARPVRIGREALRCLLARRGITFQRTKTWKESPDPAFDVNSRRRKGIDHTWAAQRRERARILSECQQRWGAHVPKRRVHAGRRSSRCPRSLTHFANRKCTMAMVSVGSMWG